MLAPRTILTMTTDQSVSCISRMDVLSYVCNKGGLATVLPLRSLPSGPRGRGGDRHDHDHKRRTTEGFPQEGGTLPLALPADVHGVLRRWGDIGRSVLRWRRTHRLSGPDRPSSRVLDPGTHRHPHGADGRVDALSPSRMAALT